MARDPRSLGYHDIMLYVRMGWLSYLMSWSCLHTIHAFCGVYFIVAGLVYWGIPDTRLVWHIELYGTTLPHTHFRTIAVVHYLLAASHFGAMLVFFLRLVYRRVTSRSTREKHENMSQTALQSRHFETVFVVRELFDSMLQAYQAFMMSHLVPRKVLNRGYVALLILNCWSTPLLLRVVQTPAMRRFLCILLHIVLGLISSIAIPAFLAMDYYGDYDPTLTTFPSRKWFSDRWRISILNESPIILFGSCYRKR
ncbi:hypothetical protein ATCC90586_009768 [Pythium insidiosum]|nr:hypothetical protein ATCC90586_009768 [Pythium insidiosum]